MTNTQEHTGIPLDEVLAAARDLATAGRWGRAASLLDATTATDARGRALVALAAAQIALDGDWVNGTRAAPGRLDTAEQASATATLDPASRWDLAHVRLRQAYSDQVHRAGQFRPGPHGRDPAVLADLRRRAGDLHAQAPDDVRRGWAQMYLGLIADNLYAERDAAPAHYEAALRAGESGDEAQATGFLAGTDPTAPPDHDA